VSATSGSTPVAVVTGGALGIGAAIAEELGRHGLFVVTVDPGVAVDGTPQDSSGELTTAQRIVDAGGEARASNISVTDADAVRALFTGLVDEFGALDAVVNVAGISRATGFANGTEDDWRAVLTVHLDGYLNVLRAALPLMTAAGHGRILGVTSGSGWRAADAGAYSCAKRAVAALTWRIGRETPDGVTVNALSPLAATRMVLGALSRQAGASAAQSRSSTGGVSLGAVPPPEHLGPVGAYLAGERFSSWCRGQIVYSNGAEATLVVPPRLIEVVRTTGVGSLSRVLATSVPAVFAPAEAAQGTHGGANPRLGDAFDEPTAKIETAPASGHAVVVTDERSWETALADALSAHRVESIVIGEPATDFAGAAKQLAAAVGDADVDAVVVARAGDRAAPSANVRGWLRVLEEHAGITDAIRTDAAWVRAVADLSAAQGRSMRVVTLVDATDSGGRSRAQAAAQLSRAAHPATSDRVDAFAIGVETATARREAAELVAHLVTDADAGALSGAELVVGVEWFGLRSHPAPAGTISFGGPAMPDWVDGALREMVTGGPGEPRDEEA
jgi:NAD(P)-dependent dehydrogenase (short-subunit alcohol dehydrogenase family)